MEKDKGEDAGAGPASRSVRVHCPKGRFFLWRVGCAPALGLQVGVRALTSHLGPGPEQG